MLPVMPDEAEYLSLIGSSFVGGHCPYEQSSISDSVGQLPRGSAQLETRIGSAFFTPHNNLC